MSHKSLASILAVVTSLLAGCGQKGALYLPPPPPQVVTSPAPAASTPTPAHKQADEPNSPVAP